MACAIGGGFCRSVKPVVGALAEVTNCFGTSKLPFVQAFFAVCAIAFGITVPHFLQVRASSLSKKRL
jgi:hypothetical protein